MAALAFSLSFPLFPTASPARYAVHLRRLSSLRPSLPLHQPLSHSLPQRPCRRLHLPPMFSSSATQSNGNSSTAETPEEAPEAVPSEPAPEQQQEKAVNEEAAAAAAATAEAIKEKIAAARAVGDGGGFWGGVVEEIGEIEWPVFGKVLGTTGVVLTVIAGSSVVLLTVNAILAELSDRVFAGKGVQDFF